MAQFHRSDTLPEFRKCFEISMQDHVPQAREEAYEKNESQKNKIYWVIKTGSKGKRIIKH